MPAGIDAPQQLGVVEAVAAAERSTSISRWAVGRGVEQTRDGDGGIEDPRHPDGPERDGPNRRASVDHHSGAVGDYTKPAHRGEVVIDGRRLVALRRPDAAAVGRRRRDVVARSIRDVDETADHGVAVTRASPLDLGEYGIDGARRDVSAHTRSRPSRSCLMTPIQRRNACWPCSVQAVDATTLPGERGLGDEQTSHQPPVGRARDTHPGDRPDRSGGHAHPSPSRIHGGVPRKARAGSRGAGSGHGAATSNGNVASAASRLSLHRARSRLPPMDPSYSPASAIVKASGVHSVL